MLRSLATGGSIKLKLPGNTPPHSATKIPLTAKNNKNNTVKKILTKSKEQAEMAHKDVSGVLNVMTTVMNNLEILTEEYLIEMIEIGKRKLYRSYEYTPFFFEMAILEMERRKE